VTDCPEVGKKKGEGHMSFSLLLVPYGRKTNKNLVKPIDKSENILYNIPQRPCGRGFVSDQLCVRFSGRDPTREMAVGASQRENKSRM